jgi:DNA repair protein RadC
MQSNNKSLNVSEVELIYRSKIKLSEMPSVLCSQDAYDIFMNAWDIDKLELLEQFKVLFLNRANKVIGIFNVSTGGVTGTVSDPRIIFAAALKINACSMILAHNHPSGSLKPSQADNELTQKISNAGKFLDIKVLDHLIVHTESYLSFADEGIM